MKSRQSHPGNRKATKTTQKTEKQLRYTGEPEKTASSPSHAPTKAKEKTSRAKPHALRFLKIAGAKVPLSPAPCEITQCSAKNTKKCRRLSSPFFPARTVRTTVRIPAFFGCRMPVGFVPSPKNISGTEKQTVFKRKTVPDRARLRKALRDGFFAIRRILFSGKIAGNPTRRKTRSGQKSRRAVFGAFSVFTELGKPPV